MAVAPSTFSSLQFGRQWDLKISTYRGDVYNFKGTTANPSSVQFTFTVSRMILRTYQFSEITLYNLSPLHETDILQNGAEVFLSAGYENGQYGQIFRGEIRQPIRGKEDAGTYYMKLVCIDSDSPLNLGICNFVLSQGVTMQEVAQQVARQSSIPFDLVIDDSVSVQLSSQRLARGKVVHGQPKKFLRNIAKSVGGTVYADQNSVYLTGLSKSPPAIVPFLNAKSGMIGMPQQTDDGITVRTLINPSIALDGWVKLNNQDIILNEVEFGVPQTLLDQDGLYRVIGITATGDTRGNDWYFDLDAINQKSSLPAMVSATGQDGY